MLCSKHGTYILQFVNFRPLKLKFQNLYIILEMFRLNYYSLSSDGKRDLLHPTLLFMLLSSHISMSAVNPDFQRNNMNFSCINPLSLFVNLDWRQAQKYETTSTKITVLDVKDISPSLVRVIAFNILNKVF